ncbi:hypothetical protein B0H10DRAFT_2432007 [Mycena sp. CBHHK59/15]|nr:hypothetical protein B0H10DRAFT_2432007 [Mycena sp. CBHHK59/15]
MAPFLSPFVAAQAVGLSASGFFLFSTMSISPWNIISMLEPSDISLIKRAPLYGRAFFGRGRPVFIGTAFGGAGAYLLAYLNRPSDISLEHSRALLAAAATLVVAVPHTVIWMLPIYKGLANEKYSGTEVEAKERWNGLMKRFYGGNSIRLVLYATAYALGIYGLAASHVTSFV